MTPSPLKIAIIAGEASGDLLGAHLLRALRTAGSTPLDGFGIGGPLMQKEGFKSYFAQEDLAVRGYTEIIRSLPKIIRIRRQITRLILDHAADIFIGIDLPDFNFAVEKKLHARGIKVIHYVSPSVWAWRRRRAGKIIKFIDHLLCLFPMEPPIYTALGGKASYVGHPLADTIPLNINQADSRKKLGLNPRRRYIALLPGSRTSEIAFMAPVFLQTAHKLAAINPDTVFIIPTVNPAGQTQIEDICRREHLSTLNLQFINDRQKHLMLAAADLALVTSGTATLETALCHCPMLISYKISPFTYYLVKPMLRTHYIGLPNILAEKSLCPELLQRQANPDTLTSIAVQWLQNPQLAADFRREAVKLHKKLRKNTAKVAAAVILTTLQQVLPPLTK